MVSIKQRVLSVAPILASVLYNSVPKSFDTPADTYAIAEFDQDIKGYVKFSPSSSGSIQVDVDLSNLPDEGGPFMYHIHECAVPSNGDCYGTGLHLNPFQSITPCSAAPDNSFCEAGDLSGKHGFIYGKSLQDSYVDEFISLNPDNSAFVGGLSITIHLADNTRIACSNLTVGSISDIETVTAAATVKEIEIQNSSNSSSSSSIGGAAAMNGVGSGAFIIGAAGLAAMLL